MYKVKILTCYCGEPSFNFLVKKLKRQRNISIDQHVISNLNLADANSEYYRQLIKTDSSYDFVIKLDADMLPRYNNAIYDACTIAAEKDVTRLTLPVLDLYTKSSIFGIHIISNKVLYSMHAKKFTPNNDRWIKDIDGKTLFHSKNILFYHGALPSKEQMFRFGYQRGLKLKGADGNHAHWQTARLIHKNFKNKSNNKNKLIFTGLLAGLDLIKSTNTKFFKAQLREEKISKMLANFERAEIQNRVFIMRERFFLYPDKLNFSNKIIFLISIYKNLFLRCIHSCIGNFQFKKVARKPKTEEPHSA